jgi:hypothetical protein
MANEIDATKLATALKSSNLDLSSLVSALRAGGAALNPEDLVASGGGSGNSSCTNTGCLVPDNLLEKVVNPARPI